ncbi:MAG: transcription-repair coupling factor [Verrucomicrobiota bacterium]
MSKDEPGGESCVFDQVVHQAQPFVTGAILSEMESPGRRIWILCRDANQQEWLSREIPHWWKGSLLYFPQHEGLTSELALPDPDLAAERLGVLQHLCRTSREPEAVLLHHESLEEPVPTPEAITRQERILKKGEETEMDDLCHLLEEAGFERIFQVVERGQFAVRGGIIDVFSWQDDAPVRIEFFDTEIESLRRFDIDSQTSFERLDFVTLLLREEEEGLQTFRDYVQDNDRMVAIECGAEAPSECRIQITEATTSADENHQPPWRCDASPLGDFGAGDFVLQETKRAEFVRQLKEWDGQKWALHMFFNNQGETERFEELLGAKLLKRLPLNRHEGNLTSGFTIPEPRIAVLSDAEIFGRYQHARAQRLLKRTSQQRLHSKQAALKELNPDDYVVHAEYGIGRYEGLEEIEREAGIKEEVLVIEYADESKLFVPLDSAHLVSRYIGVGKKAPALSKLGTGKWLRTKKAAEKAIMDFAGELLRVQAERQTYRAFAHPPDNKWQWEFENAFLYKETRDQLQAINEMKEDMESERPMDRLICGDVGFGKTEVAIRGVFKAVMSGKQAAILVPTTVLAQQHHQGFRERMSDYPIRIDLLTRYRTPAEQRATVKGMADGSVDIVIGTHRLISKDIAFKNLGVVVIDEEQRFGVRHKERFKEMFRLIDVLTLSATPIPRTLYLSLMGVKDMSTIETPPPNRLPVHTTICGYDERLVREAINRERKRGGQVFYLHNRVLSIEGVAKRIEELCPGTKTGVGHGQMEEGQLEVVMNRFIEGKIDVLVCTTIIESGIDIPNANTIIIDRADRFGLADLYQLRGRVGRAQKKAYAILMLPPHLLTTGDARKRVQAIKQYSSLGAGFKIAMRDLEIRGAGNLLGTQQSGHIAAVGFDLYCQLLKQSVAARSGQTVSRADVPLRIDFLVNSEAEYLQSEDRKGSVPAFVPTGYMEEARLRILAYRQIAEASTMKELKAMKGNWRDRFGAFPRPVENLLACTELKIMAAHANISQVEIKNGKLMLTRNGHFLQLEGKFPELKKRRNRDKITEAIELVRTVSF